MVEDNNTIVKEKNVQGGGVWGRRGYGHMLSRSGKGRMAAVYYIECAMNEYHIIHFSLVELKPVDAWPETAMAKPEPKCLPFYSLISNSFVTLVIHV